MHLEGEGSVAGVVDGAQVVRDCVKCVDVKGEEGEDSGERVEDGWRVVELVVTEGGSSAVEAAVETGVGRRLVGVLKDREVGEIRKLSVGLLCRLCGVVGNSEMREIVGSGGVEVLVGLLGHGEGECVSLAVGGLLSVVVCGWGKKEEEGGHEYFDVFGRASGCVRLHSLFCGVEAEESRKREIMLTLLLLYKNKPIAAEYGDVCHCVVAVLGELGERECGLALSALERLVCVPGLPAFLHFFHTVFCPPSCVCVSFPVSLSFLLPSFPSFQRTASFSLLTHLLKN
jgi:hypothetical protein